jgi:hypothetical protein
VKVTDAYSGDREWLLGIWPDWDIGPDAHEHFHHDGCFYWHEHPGGPEPHHHTYDCGNEIHGPGRQADCIMPPEVADPDKHRTESKAT